VSAELLSDLIEGRAYAYGQQTAEADLARLARACRTLGVPGPGAEAARRLETRLDAFLTRPQWRWWEGWSGPVARPLAQRMAAGALLLSVATGGASAAAGVPPTELAAETGSFVKSVILNLDPTKSGGDAGPAATPSPAAQPTTGTQSPSPAASTPAASETPQPTGGAIATKSPEPEDEDEDETPEPGDDNGGSRRGEERDGTPESSADGNSGRGSES